MAPRRRAMPQHCHQRRDARASRDQEQRSAKCSSPHKVTADRPAHLEAVANTRLRGEIGRNLAVIDALHCEGELRRLRCRCDRITALRLVAVLRRQPNINMLSWPMCGPPKHV